MRLEVDSTLQVFENARVESDSLGRSLLLVDRRPTVSAKENLQIGRCIKALEVPVQEGDREMTGLVNYLRTTERAGSMSAIETMAEAVPNVRVSITSYSSGGGQKGIYANANT